jgi:hypothetical protein
MEVQHELPHPSMSVTYPKSLRATVECASKEIGDEPTESGKSAWFKAG